MSHIFLYTPRTHGQAEARAGRLDLRVLLLLALSAFFTVPTALAAEASSNNASLSTPAATEQTGTGLSSDLQLGPRVTSPDKAPIKTAEVGLDGALRFGPTKEPLSDLLANNGDAGLGVALRFEDSLYIGGGMRYDLVPLYLYEGDSFYLQAYRVGVKYLPEPEQRFDMFLAHRFEGYPYNQTPNSLVGMAARNPGLDAGVSYQWKGEWGNYFAEYLRDVSGTSLGSELQLGFSYDIRSDALQLTPSIVFSVRDAKLNNYYYGVLPGEATANRPVYEAGLGINTRIGVDARYDLTDHWRLIGGIFMTRWSDEVRFSPIVESRLQVGGFVGLDYNFSPAKRPLDASAPLIVKVLYGKSTDCNLLPTLVLACTSIQTEDHTSVTGVELGKSFVENFNDWPIDFVGYVSALSHDEQGLQPDFWQFNAYMKAYYYGFPWSNHVRTRLGLGVGLSYVQSISYVEKRDQLLHGRDTSSKLLNYLDPTIDLSVGDLFGIASQRETYFGFGVTHRSGIFGSSQVLGNVDGGSNYIYTYLEWRM